MTADWKSSVRVRLAELGKDHRWLEGTLGVGRGMVTKMLSDEQRTSALVSRTSEILGIPPPLAAITSAEEVELLTLYRKLSPRSRRHVVSTAELLSREVEE